MKNAAYSYGLEAEEIALAYFISCGYSLAAKRYKTNCGEIDLVVFNEKTLVFVEVKARNNPLHMELISPKAIKRYCNAATIFLAMNPIYENKDVRFDYIYIESGEIKTHIEAAWDCSA